MAWWNRGGDKDSKYEADPVNAELQAEEDAIQSDAKRHKSYRYIPIRRSQKEEQEIVAEMLDKDPLEERFQKGEPVGGIQPEYSRQRNKPVDMEAEKKHAADDRWFTESRETSRKEDKERLEDDLFSSPPSQGFRFREEGKDSSGRSR